MNEIILTVTKKDIWDAITKAHSRDRCTDSATPFAFAAARAFGVKTETVRAFNYRGEFSVLIHTDYYNINPLYRLMYFLRFGTINKEKIREIKQFEEAFWNFTYFTKGSCPKPGISIPIIKLGEWNKNTLSTRRNE